MVCSNVLFCEHFSLNSASCRPSYLSHSPLNKPCNSLWLQDADQHIALAASNGSCRHGADLRPCPVDLFNL